MKSRLLWLVTPALVLSSLGANAQMMVSMTNGDKEDTLSTDTAAQLTAFSGRYFSGKIYLNWVVRNQRTSGSYIVYRSTDNKNFEALGFKHAVGVTIPDPINYYFADESPKEGYSYYRVIYLGLNGTSIISDIATVYVEYRVLSDIYYMRK